MGYALPDDQLPQSRVEVLLLLVSFAGSDDQALQLAVVSFAGSDDHALQLAVEVLLGSFHAVHEAVGSGIQLGYPVMTS